MNKILSVLLVLSFIFSCFLYSTPPLGETNFPLKQVTEIPISGVIKKIAIGNTWIAIQTYDAVTALDLDTFEKLWTLNIQVSRFGSGFLMDEDMLVTASEEQIILLDKQGNQREIDVDDDVKTIIRILDVNSGYIYIVGGPKWTLEAYDYSQNTMLWKKRVGRGIIDVSYDATNKFAHVTMDDAVYVNDNLTGKTLQKIPRQYGEHLIDGVLYTFPNIDRSDTETHYEINAVDIKTQKTLWHNSFVLPANNYVGGLLIVGNLLIFSGDGMVALDKSNGQQSWKIDGDTFGEELDIPPVELGNIIFAIGYASDTVFAISADDGSIIGTANLESDGPFGNSYGEVFRLEDSILFNTSNSVVIYKIQ